MRKGFYFVFPLCRCFILVVAFILFANSLVIAGDFSGKISLENRLFFSDPFYEDQETSYYSLVLSPEYHTSWNDGQDSLLFAPFFRIDSYDKERTHFDLRELYWRISFDQLDLNIGLRKMFWGVTEASHLVDIINQTDLVESPDGEEKLGQPMVNLTYHQDWGAYDIFIMPYFRERTFPSKNGRPRLGLVETDEVEYESELEEYQYDIATRVSIFHEKWDIGLSYFYGTGRDPIFLVRTTDTSESYFIPRYEIIRQAGLDVQYTNEAWLWKLELITRNQTAYDYIAADAGFEYLMPNIFGTSAEFGLLLEYLYDKRGQDKVPLSNSDYFFGIRLSANDVKSTNMLAGILYDRETGDSVVSLELERRLTSFLTMEFEARIYNFDSDGAFAPYDRDDFVLFQLNYYL